MRRTILLLFLSALLLLSCSESQFTQVDTIIENSIEEHIFPGAVLVVGDTEEIIYEKAYGNYTYDNDSKKVKPDVLFDLASLSKVFATSMCIMKCIDSGLVDPKMPVAYYLPEFAENGKELVTVRDLLIHHSGMPAYDRPTGNRDSTLKHILTIAQALEIGNYRYSCLNYITLMRVCEVATSMPMWQFYKQEFTEPMGLENTFFVPAEDRISDCMPTMGDSTGSKILLQGRVHDPLARDLEGYSGNAGLFSTAEDLAAFCQLMMNNGTYNGHEYVSAKTIAPFKTLQKGHRAFGWGINNVPCSAGSLMSENAIGHTGYTGTCAWMDLDRGVFIVLLTNRVYPLDKKGVTPVRKAVNDKIIQLWDLKEN